MMLFHYNRLPCMMMAIFAAIVWGTTFVVTKVLLLHGLTPASIFFYRFLLAYAAIWFFCPKRLWAGSVKDEFLFLCLGITGGSLYFITENTALTITLASNVSLILCTLPLITAFLSHFFVRGERLRKSLVYGSLIALGGVALVIFNGSFILKIHPLGDILTLTAALLWALYTIILKRFDGRYPVMFITRKVFFYGLLTLLPFFHFPAPAAGWNVLLRPAVWGNLLFLGLVASMLCYVLWNTAIKYLGAIRTSNCLYFVPVVTLITSSIFLHEPVTPVALLGTALILTGVYIAERNGTRM
jgi:drug/metabolite transporter (DMT)-like permease